MNTISEIKKNDPQRRKASALRKLKPKYKVEYHTYEDGVHVCVAYPNGDWFCDCGNEGEQQCENNARLIVKALNKYFLITV